MSRRLDGLRILSGDSLEISGDSDFVGDVLIQGTLTLLSSVISGGSSSDALTITGPTGTTLTVVSTQDSNVGSAGAAEFYGGIRAAKNITAVANLISGNNVVVGNYLLLKNASIGSSGNDIILNGNGSDIAIRPSNSANNALYVKPSGLEYTNGSGVVKTSITNGGNVSAISLTTEGTVTAGTNVVVGNNILLKNSTIGSSGNDIILNGNGSDIAIRPSNSANNALYVKPSGLEYTNGSGTVKTSITNGGDVSAISLTTEGTVTAGTALHVKNVVMTSNNNDLFINTNNDSVYLRPKGQGNATNNFVVTTTKAGFTNNLGVEKTSITNGENISTVTLTTEGNVTVGGDVNIKNTSVTSTGDTLRLSGNGGDVSLRPNNTFNYALIANPSNVEITDASGVAKTTITNGGDISCISVTTTGNVSAQQFVGGVSGSFLPGIPSDTSITYTSRTGFYYKIGNMVYVNIRIVTSGALAISSALALAIDNLPFANNSGVDTSGTAYLENYPFYVSTDTITPYIPNGTTYCNFAASRDNLLIALLEIPTTSANRILQATFSYYTG